MRISSHYLHTFIPGLPFMSAVMSFSTPLGPSFAVQTMSLKHYVLDFSIFLFIGCTLWISVQPALESPLGALHALESHFMYLFLLKIRFLSGMIILTMALRMEDEEVTEWMVSVENTSRAQGRGEFVFMQIKKLENFMSV